MDGAALPPLGDLEAAAVGSCGEMAMDTCGEGAVLDDGDGSRKGVAVLEAEELAK
jgi:hypothetical protein